MESRCKPPAFSRGVQLTQLHLKQIVATTTTGNEASIGVMRKVGMRIEKNPSPDPPGFQVVGILENRLTHGLPTGP